MKATLFAGKRDNSSCVKAYAPFLFFYFQICFGFCGPPVVYKKEAVAPCSFK